MKFLKLTFYFLTAFTFSTLVYSQENNTFLGDNAGTNTSTGSDNTFLGSSAGENNTSGDKNTFIGRLAGAYGSTGIQNTFIGGWSGYVNNGSNNTFLGYLAGRQNTTGDSNTFIGLNSGNKNETGSNNVFLGIQTGFLNTTGNENVCLGAHAGRKNTIGEKNVYIGTYAGFTNPNGSYNVFLGNKAGYNETGNNKLHIANNPSSTLIYGEFDNGKVGINTTSPENELDVCGIIRGNEVKVQSGWCDFVFEDDYQLQTLEEEEAYVAENGYLSGFESEEEMEGEIQLGDVTFRQQQKIEEIMLHLFEMNKKISTLEQQNEELQKENTQLKQIINKH